MLYELCSQTGTTLDCAGKMRCCEWSVCDALGPKADLTNTGGRGVATNGLGAFSRADKLDFVCRDTFSLVNSFGLKV